MHPPALSPLIAPSDLRALLAQPAADVLVLDARFQLAQPDAGRRAHAQSHIPGAIHADLDADLSGPKDGRHGRHPLPTPEAFEATARRWGLRPDTRVVAYDDTGGMFAARAWWLVRWAGHETVQVLDGGWGAWLAEGGAQTSAPSTRAPNPSWTISPHARDVVDTQDVLDNLRQGGPLQLIDARAPDRFKGENETLDPVGGHIPGALNRFFQLNLGADGRFKPAEQLRQEYVALLQGLPPHDVVHQCGSGVTACHNLLAMALAGLEGSRLYAGSWSAWCADPARPVAR